MSLSPIVLRTGGPSFLPHSTVLRAGPLTMLLEQGEIRRVKRGESEILRRIYLALRGTDWRTIQPTVADLKVEQGPEAFRATYRLLHKQDEFDFAWDVVVEGDAFGRLRFHAEGKAGSAFATNRVGLCLLHPPKESAGRPVRWTAPDGTAKEGHFPTTISPHEPFKEIVAFSHQLVDGTWVDLAYAGETFEMEDQRNWTDGSFKTYCPPAHRPKPRKLEAGWTLIQGVTLELRGGDAPAAARPANDAPGVVTLRCGDPYEALDLPAIGLGLASHGRPLGPKDIERIRALKPSHLRANFRLAEAGLGEFLDRAASEAESLGTALEAALVVGEDVEGTLAAFAAEVLRRKPPVSHWLIFHQKSDSTPPSVLEASRRHLEPVLPGKGYAIGSKNDFVLLNRGRPALPDGDDAFAVFAMCPQVHAFDNRNIVEALEGQSWTLRTAREATHGRLLFISTVSLKRTPFAASLKLSGPPADGAWRQQSDTRQLSLFGAGWTLASIKRLAAAQAVSATYHETTGPLGVLAGESLDPAERDFPGVDFRLDPGWAFPVWHVLLDISEFEGGRVEPVSSSDSLRCDGLVLRHGSRRRMLLANLEETPVTVVIENFTGDMPMRMRRLDESSAREAVENPETFRKGEGVSMRAKDGILRLALNPFELVRLDVD